MCDPNSAKGSQANVAKSAYRSTIKKFSLQIPATDWKLTDHGSHVTAVPTDAFRTQHGLSDQPGSSAGKQ
jgi:hypothetical protein